jgi:hypothetical protein
MLRGHRHSNRPERPRRANRRPFILDELAGALRQPHAYAQTLLLNSGSPFAIALMENMEAWW